MGEDPRNENGLDIKWVEGELEALSGLRYVIWDAVGKKWNEIRYAFTCMSI